jgi:hypothetical protein
VIVALQSCSIVVLADAPKTALTFAVPSTVTKM